ncbi:hypothetical protein KXX03_000176 [Aspergillus fumigatus]|nr:hypothetical protein KXX03_000176 [Aspergillus fumigatus]
MMTSTSARPGTLIESSGYMRSNDSLKWKDVELYMVKHPEDPNCQMLLMRVKHRLNKGRRNRGVPPVYTYTERNDNLGLCVIQDILEYAFLDNAFATHRLSTPIHFKESMKEIPIFRRPVKDSEGRWITHPALAYQYDRAEEYEIATSRSAGLKTPGSLYKYRKGAAANLRHLDEHSRNIIMGHKRSGKFAYYVQVQDDTQSAFMETPARTSLIKLATNSSLTRDASVPEFQKAKHKVRAERKKLHKAAKEKQYEEFFEGVENHIIEGNYQGQPITFEPDTSHVVPERRALADLEFKNRDVDKVNDAELVEDRIQSLEMRLALHNLDLPRVLQKRIRFDEASADLVAEKPFSPKE